jgi:hypothetical protein
MSPEYPSEEFLAWVRTYDILAEGPCKLIQALKDEWQWDHLIRWYPKTRTLKISTGGWSGHEDIMSALQENPLFFAMYWRATVRGGHYTFRIEYIKRSDIGKECLWSIYQKTGRFEDCTRWLKHRAYNRMVGSCKNEVPE